MLINVIPTGKEPLKVLLWHLNIWIQIHDLPTGFISEVVGKQLGNFFGEFLLYDTKNNFSIWRDFIRVKICFDVRNPLKRRKRLHAKMVQNTLF